jgi:hypothetical protein
MSSLRPLVGLLPTPERELPSRFESSICWMFLLPGMAIHRRAVTISPNDVHEVPIFEGFKSVSPQC